MRMQDNLQPTMLHLCQRQLILTKNSLNNTIWIRFIQNRLKIIRLICCKIYYVLVPDDKNLALLKLKTLNVLKRDGLADINFGVLAEFRDRDTALSVIARQKFSKSW